MATKPVLAEKLRNAAATIGAETCHLDALVDCIRDTISVPEVKAREIGLVDALAVSLASLAQRISQAVQQLDALADAQGREAEA